MMTRFISSNHPSSSVHNAIVVFSEEGVGLREILASANMITAATLAEAAEKAVAASRGEL